MVGKRFQRLRLEWKLPLAIGTVLIAVLGAVTWMAYLEVADAALDSTIARGAGVAQPLAGYLGTQAANDARSLAVLADDDVLASHLRTPAPESQTRALEILTTILQRRTTHYAVELRNASGQIVLAVGPTAEQSAAVPVETILDAVGSRDATGPFVPLNGNVGWPVIAAVTRDEGVLGYVVEWRHLTTTREQQQATVSMLGEGSALLLGSPDGAWTDQVSIVPPPPVDFRGVTAAVRYRREDSGGRIGLVEQVPGTPWLVLIEYSAPAVLAPANAFLRRILLLAALLFVMATAVGWLLVRRITGPLRNLTAAAESLSDGDYSPRVRIEGTDEVARLGSAFNEMASRVEDAHSKLESSVRELQAAREQFIHAQRMEAVGQLAAGVAHDFNNLLTVILGEVDLASAGLTDPLVTESLDGIRRAGERATLLTRQLLAFSRRQLMEPSAFDLNDLVEDSKRMLVRLIGENINVVTRTMADPPTVYADRSQIEQVIVNLVVNARDAMLDGGQLIIETANTVLDEDYARTRDDVVAGEYVMLSVSDTGSGMPADVLKRIFEPFYTTKEHGRGTGLGLATCYGIVKQLGGHIAAYSEPGVGTTMRVYLPRATSPVATNQSAGRTGTPTGGEETILLVEDEATVRKLAVRMLTRQGYRVIDAADAEQALELLEEFTEPIDLLLTDVVLPQMGGRELADRVAAARPGIRILYASGYSDDVVLRHQLIDGEVALLQKPYTAESLGRKIREVLAG